jgi:hypothetical protein
VFLVLCHGPKTQFFPPPSLCAQRAEYRAENRSWTNLSAPLVRRGQGELLFTILQRIVSPVAPGLRGWMCACKPAEVDAIRVQVVCLHSVVTLKARDTRIECPVSSSCDAIVVIHVAIWKCTNLHLSSVDFPLCLCMLAAGDMINGLY